MTVEEIKKKYNLTNNKWKRIRDSLAEEFGLSDRVCHNLHNKQERGGRVPKNYYQKTHDCKYYVSKSINGRTEHVYAD